jgi:disulfide bond formation protein DsbB
LLAVIGLAGSLWLTIGMELKPCPLCYYQRTFVMAVVGILGVGLLTSARRSSPLSILALPAALGGLGVALFHEYLELTGKLECPLGIGNIGSAPLQSVILLAILTYVLVRDAVRAGSNLSVLLAVVLGGGLAVGSIQSVLPKPTPPKEPYKTPVDICRPPFATSE